MPAIFATINITITIVHANKILQSKWMDNRLSEKKIGQICKLARPVPLNGKFFAIAPIDFHLERK